jgi:O-antigen/teichoic acid export membrane protein
MVFSGETNAQLSDVMIRFGRMQSYLVSLIACGFVAFGQQFIAWYAGTEYQLSYWIALIIIIPNCIPLIQSVALAILRAKNMHKFRSILYTVIAIANFVGTLLLIRPWGLIGASIPTGLALLIGNGVIINIYYWKKVGLDIPRFWKQVLPSFAIGSTLVVITLLCSVVIDFYNPITLFSGILIFSLIHCLLIWLFVMHPSEKDMLKKLMKRDRT